MGDSKVSLQLEVEGDSDNEGYSESSDYESSEELESGGGEQDYVVEDSLRWDPNGVFHSSDFDRDRSQDLESEENLGVKEKRM